MLAGRGLNMRSRIKRSMCRVNKCIDPFWQVAQSAERRVVNSRVAGSSPVLSAKVNEGVSNMQAVELRACPFESKEL